MPAARRKLRETATVLVVLAVALLMLGRSASDPGRLGPVDRALLALLTPLQAALRGSGTAVVTLGHRYLALVGVEQRNAQLFEDNRQLRAAVARLARAAQENARLNQLLALRDLLDAPTVAARVVAIDTSPYFRVGRVTIDKGAGLVERGMPVLAPEGVVGRISRVAGDSADVELALDPHSVIHVRTPRSGGRGLLIGHPGAGRSRCRIRYFTGPPDARVGDHVVTTGLGGFPQDLAVGTVSRVTQAPGALFPEIDVELAVDFTRLGEVLVLLAPPAGRPLPGADRDRESGPPTLPPPPSRGLSFYR